MLKEEWHKGINPFEKARQAQPVSTPAGVPPMHLLVTPFQLCTAAWLWAQKKAQQPLRITAQREFIVAQPERATQPGVLVAPCRELYHTRNPRSLSWLGTR